MFDLVKKELISLMNIHLMNSLRLRDSVDPSLYPEEYGFYNGQYRAYEAVIGLLVTVDIQSIFPEDSRNFQ